MSRLIGNSTRNDESKQISLKQVSDMWSSVIPTAFMAHLPLLVRIHANSLTGCFTGDGCEMRKHHFSKLISLLSWCKSCIDLTVRSTVIINSINNPLCQDKPALNELKRSKPGGLRHQRRIWNDWDQKIKHSVKSNHRKLNVDLTEKERNSCEALGRLRLTNWMNVRSSPDLRTPQVDR